MSGEPLALAQALSLLFSAAFLTYWVTVLVAYLRRKPARSGAPEDFDWHFFVPCRDEAAVIGTTLGYLRATFPLADVWVIDDDSADATAAIVVAAGARDPKVHLIQRRAPDARTGKGDALNSAYRALRSHLGDGIDHAKVIVGVVDGDGQPGPNCLEVCASPHLFGDERVGGVQVEVRIANIVDRRPLPDRGRLANLFARTLVRMQDMEFRSVIGAIQTSRAITQTVGMGGNGQFTRLSALASLDDGDRRAWRGSLLEDYELGLHLMLAGHRTAFTSEAWVAQEGLPSLRRYLTQRTRWGQGVMQCMRYLPDAWNSPQLSTSGALETSYYLLQPWLSLLGSVVFPLPVIALVVSQLQAGTTMDAFLATGGWAIIAIYLVLGIVPFALWGPLYRRRCAPEASRMKAIGWGLAYVVYVYAFYITSWRAVIRLIRGQSGWSKTRRNAEFSPAPTAAALPGPGAVAVAMPAAALATADVAQSVVQVRGHWRRVPSGGRTWIRPYVRPVRTRPARVAASALPATRRRAGRPLHATRVPPQSRPILRLVRAPSDVGLPVIERTVA